MKTLSRFLCVAVFIVMIFSTFGAYAMWTYTGPVDDTQDSVQISLGIFEYKPEEVLPGDDNATELHENHNNLVISVVDHTSYGLNATKKPIIRNLLEDGAGIVYSNQNVSGGNLKHMMTSSSDVEKLMFCVQYVTDTEYHTYTFADTYVKRENVGLEIQVYKTVMEKQNNKWVATKSYAGKAKVAVVYSSSGGQLISIDVTTWKM